MPGEFAIAGVLVPAILPVFIACVLLMWLVDTLTARLGLYRYVWHPPLFRLAVFACLFALAGLLLLP